MKKYNVEVKFEDKIHKVANLYINIDDSIHRIITQPEDKFFGPFYDIYCKDLEKVELTLEEIKDV